MMASISFEELVNGALDHLQHVINHYPIEHRVFPTVRIGSYGKAPDIHVEFVHNKYDDSIRHVEAEITIWNASRERPMTLILQVYDSHLGVMIHDETTGLNTIQDARPYFDTAMGYFRLP